MTDQINKTMHTISPDKPRKTPQTTAANDKARKIKGIIFDIDGIMTDGHIVYTEQHRESKAFHVRDGLGIKLLQQNGISVAIISGRQSEALTRRAQELKIQHIIQGREDKLAASLELAKTLNTEPEHLAYMGDDLPDLAAIIHLGLGITVSDAPEIIREHADLICHNPGGRGAVREAAEFILDAQNRLADIYQTYRQGIPSA